MLESWIEVNQANHEIQLARKTSELVGGDLLLLIFCSEVVSAIERNKFSKSLVIHASD
jgi:methionyl-tRNA formyltransferase